MRPRVAVFTRTGDVHASAIRHELMRRDIGCAIVETDRIAGTGLMSWRPGSPPTARLPTSEGHTLDVHELELVWWRRFTGDPKLPTWLADAAARDLVARDCRATLVGSALTSFQGTWISDPEATRLAENKLIQLNAAAKIGLRIPHTLVSQDPSEIRGFCQSLDYRVIVKAVAGTPQTPVMTGAITKEMLTSDRQLALCPAIYQQLIGGVDHLRVCCFGERTHSALLTSERLDWRYPLDARAQRFELDTETVDQLRRLMDELGLRMGVFDLKLGPDGDPVWLEVNPQGQFLFLEGMCGLPLAEAFTDFVCDELAASGTPPATVPAARPAIKAL